MSDERKVVSFGPASLHFIFDPIVAGLRERGQVVEHHTDFTRFQRELATLLRDADVLLVSGNFPCTRELMMLSPRLRAVVSPFIGTEGFDEAAATELGIIVANGHVPENYLSMAESTILLILASLYSLHWWENQLQQGLPHPSPVPGRMLRGRTVGFIGFGKIAQGMVARFAGWEINLQAYTPRLRTSPPNVSLVSLDELLRTSDVVCILAPLNAETRGMLNLERLRLMKPDAVLINTARGGIIDEDALVQLANERPNFRVALDTFSVEPLPGSSPLRNLPNAILTPHAIGHTQESNDALPVAAIENVTRVLNGEVPRYLRNPQVLPIWKARWAAKA